MWESNANVNRRGRSIYSAMVDHPDATLITPSDLGTRLDPISGNCSTFDLSITSSALSINASVKVGPVLGSDHFPKSLAQSKIDYDLVSYRSASPSNLSKNRRRRSLNHAYHPRLQTPHTQHNPIRRPWPTTSRTQKNLAIPKLCHQISSESHEFRLLPSF